MLRAFKAQGTLGVWWPNQPDDGHYQQDDDYKAIRHLIKTRKIWLVQRTPKGAFYVIASKWKLALAEAMAQRLQGSDQ